MLNKEVCKKCWYSLECGGTVEVRNNEKEEWKEEWIMEDMWKKGILFCPHSTSDPFDNLTHINLGVPKYCPYALDHLIANRQEEINKKEKTHV